MKKKVKNLFTNNPLIVALVLVSVMCIVFALTAVGISAQLKSERIKTKALNKDIAALQKDFDVMMSEQASIINDLKNSLDVTMEEAASGSGAK